MTRLFAFLFAAALIVGLGTAPTAIYAEDSVEEAEEATMDSDPAEDTTEGEAPEDPIEEAEEGE